MSEKRVIRINKVLRELNISLERAVDFLKEKNHVIESSPNAKISQEEYDVLCDQFSADKGKKVASQEVSEEKKKEKEALKRELEKELELKRQQEEKQKQEVIKAKAVLTGPKAIGKIDLNPVKPETKKEADVPAVEQTPTPVAEEKPVVSETPVQEVKEDSKPKVVKQEKVADTQIPAQSESLGTEGEEVDEAIKTNYQKLSGATFTGQKIDLSQFNKPKKKKEEPKKDFKKPGDNKPGTPAVGNNNSAANKNKRKRITKPTPGAANTTGAPGAKKDFSKDRFNKGKKVVVQIELQARFDESANIRYAKEMQSQGIKLIFGSPNLKVHSKICLIERLENGNLKKYGFISTGNFNESTAKVYTDLTLFTSNDKILEEVSNVFNFFNANYKKYVFKNLFVSPINTETKIKKLINNEIINAKNGKESWIKIKINNITSHSLIRALYDASRAGVKIQMIVRGICCLIPGHKNMSENIEVISIVDRFLEHTRFMIFSNNENNKVFISSADWMTRNLDNRVEVTCPILQEDLKKEIIDIFNIYWSDNIKARLINNNSKSRITNKKRFNSQEKMYNYYLNKIEGL